MMIPMLSKLEILQSFQQLTKVITNQFMSQKQAQLHPLVGYFLKKREKYLHKPHKKLGKITIDFGLWLRTKKLSQMSNSSLHRFTNSEFLNSKFSDWSKPKDCFVKKKKQVLIGSKIRQNSRFEIWNSWTHVLSSSQALENNTFHSSTYNFLLFLKFWLFHF